MQVHLYISTCEIVEYFNLPSYIRMPQHSSVAGNFNMQGTATVDFFAVLIATGSSANNTERNSLIHK